MDTSVYDNVAWYEYLKQFDEPIRRATYAVFSHLGKPKTLNDFGCGACSTITAAAEMGVRAWGYECSDIPAKYVNHPMAYLFKTDLTKRIDVHKAEMSFCWEVAEHLPPEFGGILVDNIARHTSDWLVWTSAKPGQGGQYHLNEQDFVSYWKPMLENAGFVYLEDKTQQLMGTWVWVTGPMHWLVENVRVLRKA